MNERVNKQCRALIFFLFVFLCTISKRFKVLVFVMNQQFKHPNENTHFVLICVFDTEEIKSSIKLPNFNFWVFFLILTASCNSNNHSTFGKTISQWKILTIQKKVNRLMKQQVTVTCYLFLGFFFSLWAFLCLFSQYTRNPT